MKTTSEIAGLIAKKVLGAPLSEEEEQQLDAWLQSPENRKSYEEISRLAMVDKLLELERKDYGVQMADRFFAGEHRIRRARLVKRTSLWIALAAACWLAVFAISYHLATKPGKQADTLAQVSVSITPGEVKATLTLADGRQFGIDDEDSRQVDQLIDSARVAAGIAAGKADEKPVYHKLSVPRGGEYCYQLADGSKVWINSESELRFPEAFTQGERRVYLKGEAFFEIAKDSLRPFIVCATRGDICVYGTTFNVTDYENQPLSTVLVQGSIGFRPTKGEEVRLRPSQRLEYDEANGEVKVEPVDVSLYTSWIDHYFIFRAQTLEEIMNTLSRWYDFQTEFADDALRGIKFSGRLYRNEDIRVLLESYEQIAGVKFNITGHTIIITK